MFCHVLLHSGVTCQFAGLVEVDSDKLAEPGGVVVPDRLGVAPGLQHGVRLHVTRF